MTNPVTQRPYLVANGTGTIFPTVVFDRAPAVTDFNFPITQRWIDTSDENAEWFLLGFLSSVGVVSPNWVQLSSGTGTVETLTGNTGGAVGPDGTQTIHVIGDSSGIQFAGNPGTNTLTASLANIPNSSLANSSITLVAGTGISINTSPVSLGGSTTISLITPVSIANGGTNATSMSTSTGIVKFDGTRLVTSTTAEIDSSNRITNTSQPSFFVYLNTGVINVTGDGTVYSVLFDTTSYDIGSGITLNSGGKTIYTAPVTGTYSFTCGLNVGWGAAAVGNSVVFEFVNATSGVTYRLSQFNHIFAAEATIWGDASNVVVKLTAGDVLSLTVTVMDAAAKNAFLQGKVGAVIINYFSGVFLY